MSFIADFHIHSKYSYATSKFMDLQALAVWGQLKGIELMGTGDFTHPFWIAELQNSLVPDGTGLFALNDRVKETVAEQVYESCLQKQRFMLTGEISTIFSRNKKTYKVHSIIAVPTFEAASCIAQQLSQIGNIYSDGRPILGMDVKHLLEIVLASSDKSLLIPAHVWTPHFGLLGSKSGFDSFEDCFEDLSEHVYAFETGLSSNFVMNAQLSSLDRYIQLCNSDAHSVQKLGREANVLNCDKSYDAIYDMMKHNRKDQIAGIEFFPERGKYYGDGHRKCSFYLDPIDHIDTDVCTVCNKKVTIGVQRRVQQLADRDVVMAQKYVQKGFRVVPLIDIIAYNLGFSENSKKVQNLYHQMLQKIGNEFFILLQAPVEHIEKASNAQISRSIQMLRSGNITVTPGYDGQYGTIDFSL